jgi:hypothetical protein
LNFPVTSAFALVAASHSGPRGSSMTDTQDREPPLQRSIRMIKEALDLAYYYQRHPTFMPSTEDLELFVHLSETLWFYQSAANHIVRRMHARANAQMPIINRPVVIKTNGY